MNLGYPKLDNGIAALAKSSEVEPFVGGSTSLNWSIDPQTGRLTTNLGLDLGGNSIQNVSAIMSASGNWRVDESGNLVVQELEVKGKGITVYDRATGQPKCVFVENDAVRSEQGACDNNTE